MKKNLKKVISAVLALALAMSSFVVMTTSAATFADVADTASYAEAVNALAALGAIAGTGDGTFKPDDNITRAEAATMVVAALNLSADAQNAGATSKFADVNEQAKWAIGYVNVGVAQNYISGTSATTFNPLDNVTYAQMLTMLTRILGYGDFAISRGGYPDGYVTSASIAGIVKGVVAGNEEPITRAQAAQLIWNAVQAPMLDITTFTGSIDDTQLKKMDGSSAAGYKFKTVLADKFDAYVLNATVEATSKQGSLELGTISMRLSGTNEWDPSANRLLNDAGYSVSRLKTPVDAGKTDAEDYLFSSAKVVAVYNEDGEWSLIYFAPTGKIVTKEVDGSLINTQGGSYAGIEVEQTAPTTDPNGSPVPGTDTGNAILRIKKSSTSSASSATEYNLKDAELYVNGAYFCDVDTANAAAVRAMIAESTGAVTLYQDANQPGRVYNKIMMDYYVVASVNQVKTSAKDTEIRITGYPNVPAAPAVAPGTSLVIDADDLADGEVVVNVTKAGAAADLSALAKNDVVALKYNVKQPLSNFGNTFKNIDIIATTDVVSGKYASYDNEADKYNIGGVDYEAAKNQILTLGSTYTFRLDPFGRLFDAEEEATTVNYAIVEKFADITDAQNYGAEYAYLDVVTLDGQSKRLFIDTTYATTADQVMTAGGIGFSLNTNAALGIQARVIEYKVKTSTGRVNWVKISNNTDTFQNIKYNASTNRLGKPLAASVVVLDATKYDQNQPSATDYKASALSALAESVDYTGVLVHKNNSNEWGYVVIESAGATYSTSSNFAVVAATAQSSNKAIVDDEDVFQLTVMQNGDNAASKLNVSLSANIYVNGVTTPNMQGGVDTRDYSYATTCATYLREGAVFFYTTDSYGLVDRIDVVLQGGYNYNTIKALITAGNSADIDTVVKLPDINEVKNDGNGNHNTWFVEVDEKVNQASVADEQIQLFIAPVMTAGSNNISFGSMVNNGGLYVDTNADFGFSLANDVKIYEYDLGEAGTGANAFRGGAFMGFDIADADVNGKAWLTNVPANETNFDTLVQYAFVMAVDGMITNALLLNA